MKICGLNKTTLLDYPGKVAATVFLGGCNLCCPFCQNGGLVLHPDREPKIDEEELFVFLRRRQGILDGVCISGGEPTLARDLPQLLQRIKSLGYLVKLDTNGTRPKVIKQLLEQRLVDHIAMDIKSSPDNYGKVTGICHINLEEIQESIHLIMEMAPDYEFRTTVVKELHDRTDFEQISQWLKGAKAYYLQAYRDSDQVIRPGFSSYGREELEKFRKILRKRIFRVEIRGLD